MKLVVSDASPLIVIAKSGLIPVLTRLVEEIIIPEPSTRHGRYRNERDVI